MTPSSDGASALEHSAAFDVWFERFLDTVLARHPVDATYLGAHAYDHALPDFSRAADADWVTQANALIAALDAIPADGISEAQLYDRILARGALQLWIQEASAPQFQSGNPVHHTSQAIAGVAALFQDDGWPHEERVAAVIARMQAVPAFLETARRRMRSAPLVWTELAIRQAEACAAYVGALPSRDIAIDRLSFQQAASKAATAFDGHATWLRNVLAERRPAVQPAGTAALDRYLHLGHLLPAAQTPEWWFDYAHAELIEATTELRELAKAIDWRVPIRVLLRRLDDAHPNAEAYDAAIPAAWERCRAITIGARLVTWPDVPVHFAAIPAAELEFWRTFSFPIYRGAPPLAPSGAGRVIYPALDRSLPVNEQDQFLQQMNDAWILLDLVIRNAGLGHHVHHTAIRSAPTRIGRLAATSGASRRLFFCGNAVTEGWACYAAELMEEAGALTPLQRLAEAQRRLRVAARAVGDIGMHTGELTMARVARMYRDEAGLTATHAMEQAVRDSMNPGCGMAELAGAAGIDELRRTLEDRNGPGFDLNGFHDRFLRHGAIPVTLIAASMLNEPEP